MKIDKVRIQNFRKYLGLHEFNLDKQITIFYGPNGFGKSTFFDALEWCLSGSISRFSKQKDFTEQDIICFQCVKTSETCFVEIEFEGHILKRSFRVENGKAKSVTVSIKPPNGKIIRTKGKVDTFLRREFYRTEGKGMMGGLIKQSHILSQDQITEFVSHDDAKSRFEALADIMGLKNVLNLTNNIKEVSSKLSAQRSKIEIESEQLKSMIEQRTADLLTLDLSKIEEWANLLNISPDINIVYANLNKLKERLLQESSVVLDKLDRLDKVGKLEFSNIGDCITEEKNCRDNLRSYTSRLERAEKLLLQINLEIKGVNEAKNHNDRFRKMEKEEKRLIRLLQSSSNSPEILDLDNIIKSISDKQKELVKYDLAISYLEEYQKLRNEKKDLPNRKLGAEKRLSKFVRRSKRLEAMLQVVNKRIENHSGGPMIKLVADVRSVYEYVSIQNNDKDGTCPVCSANHGSELKSKIYSSIEEHLEKIRQYAEVTEELIQNKERLSMRIESNNRELISHQDEIKQIDNKHRSSIERLNAIQNLPNYDNELLLGTKPELEKTRNNLLSHIKMDEVSKEAIQSLAMVRKDLDNLRSVTGLQHALDDADVPGELHRLQRAQNRVVSYINDMKEEIKTTQIKVQNFNKVLTPIPDILSELELTYPIDELINQYQKKKIDLQIEFNLVASFSEKFSNNQRVNIKIKELSLEKEKKDALIKQKYDLKLSKISEFLNKVALQLGTTAEDILNSSYSTIQRYFRYLNPLPSTVPIRFEGGNEELKIMVQLPNEGEGLSNAQYTLSSGQLNVLAISIFLAINESQKVSILDFVGIDDPIQNMDDVNQFSVCDVLSIIKKQLLFSTHDLDFVKLFIKKNEHRREQIQLFMIDSPTLTKDNIKHIKFH